jgi:outer membrane protein TolC
MLPRLDAFADLTTANPNSRYLVPPDSFERTWAAGVQLSWSPNDFWSNRSAARAADARAAQVAAQRGAVRDQVRSEVEQDIAEVRRAHTAIGATERGLQAAEESYRVRRELFLNGRATSVELIDAQTELTQARLDAISARIDQQIARVRLEHATGTDLSVAD